MAVAKKKPAAKKTEDPRARPRGEEDDGEEDRHRSVARPLLARSSW